MCWSLSRCEASAGRPARVRLAVRGTGHRRGRDERGDDPDHAGESIGEGRCFCGRSRSSVWRRSGCGLSRWFWFTFACLALTGATDTISMIIRKIARQLETPDRLRGRMVGVNMVFFIGGPQLGEFEAGALANWLGATFLGHQRRRRLPDRDRLGGRVNAGIAALSRGAAPQRAGTTLIAEAAEIAEPPRSQRPWAWSRPGAELTQEFWSSAGCVSSALIIGARSMV